MTSIYALSAAIFREMPSASLGQLQLAWQWKGGAGPQDVRPQGRALGPRSLYILICDAETRIACGAALMATTNSQKSAHAVVPQ